MTIDEGPSPEDVARFSRDTAYCPSCGEEIWDLLDHCPRCGEILPEGPQRHEPIEHEFRRRWIVLIVIVVIVIFVLFGVA